MRKKETFGKTLSKKRDDGGTAFPSDESSEKRCERAARREKKARKKRRSFRRETSGVASC